MTKIKAMLIIDDDETILFAFKRIFQESGVRIDSTDSVLEAKKMIDKKVSA